MNELRKTLAEPFPHASNVIIDYARLHDGIPADKISSDFTLKRHELLEIRIQGSEIVNGRARWPFISRISPQYIYELLVEFY